jgi:hypothetical protein
MKFYTSVIGTICMISVIAGSVYPEPVSAQLYDYIRQNVRSEASSGPREEEEKKKKDPSGSNEPIILRFVYQALRLIRDPADPDVQHQLSKILLKEIKQVQTAMRKKDHFTCDEVKIMRGKLDQKMTNRECKEVIIKTIQEMVRAEEMIHELGRDLQSIASSYEYPIEGYPERPINLPLLFSGITSIWRAGPEGSSGDTSKEEEDPPDQDPPQQIVSQDDQGQGEEEEEEDDTNAIPGDGDVGIYWRFPIEPVHPHLFGSVDKGSPIYGGFFPPDTDKEYVSDNEEEEEQGQGQGQKVKHVDGTGICEKPFPGQGYLCVKRSKHGEECTQKIDPVKKTIILAECVPKGIKNIIEPTEEEEGENPKKKKKQVIRTWPIHPDEYPAIKKIICEDLVLALSKLDQFEQHAAGWRYQHGVRLINGSRTAKGGETLPELPFHGGSGHPLNGEETERVYLYKRFPRVETELMKLWGALSGIDDLLPPLKKGETALFVFHGSLQACLPPNMILWSWKHGEKEEEEEEGQGGEEEEEGQGGEEEEGQGDGDGEEEEEEFTTHSDIVGPNVCKNILLKQSTKEVGGGEEEEEGQGGEEEEEGQGDGDGEGEGEGEEEEAQKESGICHPLNVAKYTNSIGNTLCYIGQCMEHAAELHRYTPGRTPFTTFGQAWPWDTLKKGQTEPSEEEGGPEVIDLDEEGEGTSMRHALLTPAPIIQGAIPTYRPAYLAHKVDIALCQVNGYPPTNPPALCQYGIQRSTGYEMAMFYQMTRQLFSQRPESTVPQFGLRRLGASIGTRVGTAIYENYLRRTTRSLAETISMVNDMLRFIRATEFPKHMCWQSYPFSE